MANEHIPVGGSGLSRLLRGRGTGRVVEETAVVGDVPELLAEMLTELRRQTRLLAALVDEDIDDGSGD